MTFSSLLRSFGGEVCNLMSLRVLTTAFFCEGLNGKLLASERGKRASTSDRASNDPRVSRKRSQFCLRLLRAETVSYVSVIYWSGK